MAAILPVLLTLAVATTSAQSKDHCELRRLSACGNTNELVWEKTFRDAVERFLGPIRASYLDGSGLVVDQMLTVLGGPPDLPVKIGNRFRFTACRVHSCEEKGAAVLEPDGQLVALAILHSACGEPHRSDDCFAHETLTIFVRDPAERDVVNNLSSWAGSEIAHAYTYPGMPAEHLDAVQIEVVK